MKKLVVLLGVSAVSLMMCAGKQGPMGPQGLQGVQGEQGEQGEQGIPGISSRYSAVFYDTVGRLPPSTASTNGGDNYWLIWLPRPMFDDSLLVQPWVRLADNYLWAEPVEWAYSSMGYVKMFDLSSDPFAKAGSQFKINVVYCKKNY